MQKRRPVVVLGATGMVGQRALSLLQHHPDLEVVGLAASERSAGRSYAEACRWLLPGPAYAGAAELQVLPTTVEALCAAIPGQPLALSALPRAAARRVERPLAERGWQVVSNAGAHRDDPDVPLVIPEVNPDHMRLMSLGAGGLVTNPNCTAMPVALSLAPLHEAVGVEAITVASYQAVSGAGYPGESAWDMIGNVHPHPGDEEDKLVTEVPKILGRVSDDRIESADIAVSARCVRVPVVDGHLVAVHVRTRQPIDPAGAAELMSAWQGHHPPLRSAPSPPLRLLDARDRPQPRLDAGAGSGMAVSIGRIERCPVMGLKYFALAHNTLRGAAGAALLNAELVAARSSR